MAIDSWLSSNPALGIVLGVTLLATLYVNRSALRDVTGDPSRVWRGLARLTALMLIVVVAWISIFDNWRQLINAPFRSLQIFPSQRVVLHPITPEIRQITIILIGITAFFVACLFARHFGGYGFAMTGLVLSLLVWIPLYTLRDRFDLGLALGFGGDWRSISDVVGYVFYLLLAWGLDVLLILASFLIITTAFALPVTLFLDITRLRHPRVSGEATAFFASFSQHNGHPGTRT